MTLVREREMTWLRAFFGGNNELSLGQLDHPPINQLKVEVISWLEFLNNDTFGGPILLPFVTRQGFFWYACCANNQTLAQSLDDLRAFFGDSYAQIESFSQLDLIGKEQQALRNRFGKRFFRIKAPANSEKTIMERLSLYRQLLIQRPIRARVGVRPAGQIRYEFEQALLVHDERTATKCIDELRTTGRFSHQNQRFLEIRKLAAFGEWNQIVGDPSYLRSVIDIPLPAKIFSDLVDAIYQVFLFNFEKNLQPDEAINSFRHEISPRFGKLFRTRRGLCSPTVLKAFLLHELSGDRPDYDLCLNLFSLYPEDHSGYHYTCLLFDRAQRTVGPSDPGKRAEEAFLEEEYDLAFQLYLERPLDTRMLSRLLTCAHLVGSLDAQKKAWEVANKASEKLLASLPSKSTDIFDGLRKIFEKGDRPISDWCDWARCVIDDGNLDLAEEIAKQGSVEWSVDSFAKSPEKISDFAETLTTGYQRYPVFFQNMFPMIYEFFHLEPRITSFKPIYSRLLLILALADSLNKNELELTAELSTSLFEAGLNPEEYEDTVECLLSIWKKQKSFKYLDWALDTAELLAVYPSHDSQSPLTFFLEVVELVRSNLHRIAEHQWKIFDILSKDFGSIAELSSIEPPIAFDQSPDAKSLISGRKIGIYTLSESTGLHTKRLLQSIYNVEVEVNSDPVATDSLAALATSSDIFVFSWKAAKHQAFNCVQENLGKNTKLVYPAGKGTTSVMRSILDALE